MIRRTRASSAAPSKLSNHRVFVSGYGVMEVITSKNDQPLESAVYDLRSHRCSDSALEVVDDRVLCAMGMHGVQSVSLE